MILFCVLAPRRGRRPTPFWSGEGGTGGRHQKSVPSRNPPFGLWLLTSAYFCAEGLAKVTRQWVAKKDIKKQEKIFLKTLSEIVDLF